MIRFRMDARARPVVFEPARAKVKIIGRERVLYRADTPGWRQRLPEKYNNPEAIRKTEYTRDDAFVVLEVEVESDAFTDMKSGAPLSLPMLRGFVLERRLR